MQLAFILRLIGPPYLCSLQTSVEFIRKDKAKALDILVKRFPEIDRSVASAALDRVIEDDIVPESTVTDKEAWDKAIALRVEVGDVKKAQQIDAYVDNSFAKRAKESCGYNLTPSKP
jgi:ABC-type nitrate/sulfonate/bicarbonate transport system substrate-binding protein